MYQFRVIRINYPIFVLGLEVGFGDGPVEVADEIEEVDFGLGKRDLHREGKDKDKN